MPENPVVVITGASSGMGRATALEFARKGGRLVLGARRLFALETLMFECEALGGQAAVMSMDVANQAEVEHLAQTAEDMYGHIDVWVNAAAVYALGNLEDIPVTDIERLIDVNVKGVIWGSRCALKRFKQQGSGTLINFSSMDGVVGEPFASPYAASKFAVRGLDVSLQEELAETPGINICTVVPSVIDTPFFRHAANYYGETAQPSYPVLAADKVARQVARLPMRPRREVYAGVRVKLMSLFRMLSPNLFDRLYRAAVKAQHYQHRQPAAPTDGNLFEPMWDYPGVSGGYDGRETIVGEVLQVLSKGRAMVGQGAKPE